MYRIVDWDRIYEVNIKGHAWKPGETKREKALPYIRLKANGRALGSGWRRMVALAGKKNALMVFGLFCKLLEIAGSTDRDHRNRIGPAEELAFDIDMPVSQVTKGLNVLIKAGWVEYIPDDSGDAGKTRLLLEGKTRQGKTRQDKESNPAGQVNTDSLVEEFETEFWPKVPTKVAKEPALEAYLKARASVPKETILAGLPGYIAYEAGRKSRDGEDFRPLHPATWLNKKRWTDEVPNGAKGYKCSCGKPADGVSTNDTGHKYGWCRTCQPRKWEAMQK